MKSKHGIIIVLLSVAVAFAPVTVAVAADKPQKNDANKILDTVSKEGHEAWQDLRHARIAIFDGQPQQAEELLEKAKENLATAEKQAPQTTVTVKTVEKMGGKTVDSTKTSETNDLIRVDTWVGLTEDFVPTPEKASKVKEANEHLKKGEKAKAVEVLREAGIDVSITSLLMPLKSTIKDVDKAISLMKEQKYYEANLALKGAEDGVTTDMVLLNEPSPPAEKTEKK